MGRSFPGSGRGGARGGADVPGVLKQPRDARGRPTMALRRVVSALRPGPARLARLSTAPVTREQPAGPRAVPEPREAEAARPPVPAVDFGNAQEAYRSRRSWELARSLLVLRLCASPALLARHEQVRGRAAGGGPGAAPLPIPGPFGSFRV